MFQHFRPTAWLPTTFDPCTGTSNRTLAVYQKPPRRGRIHMIIIGSVAKWLCCPLREATSAALPYTRRAGFLVLPESTRPVQPRSTEPQPPSPKRNFTRGGVLSRSDWLQTPLRHASNPCGSFSLRASANWCVLGPTEGATTHHPKSTPKVLQKYSFLHIGSKVERKSEAVTQK